MAQADKRKNTLVFLILYLLIQALTEAERIHKQELQNKLKDLEKKYQSDAEAAEKQHENSMAKLRNDFNQKFNESREQLEIGRIFKAYTLSNTKNKYFVFCQSVYILLLSSFCC